MKRKPLSQTNPYLRDPKTREKFIDISVKTSSAVEGIYVDLTSKSSKKSSSKNHS